MVATTCAPLPPNSSLLGPPARHRLHQGLRGGQHEVDQRLPRVWNWGEEEDGAKEACLLRTACIPSSYRVCLCEAQAASAGYNLVSVVRVVQRSADPMSVRPLSGCNLRVALVASTTGTFGMTSSGVDRERFANPAPLQADVAG